MTRPAGRDRVEFQTLVDRVGSGGVRILMGPFESGRVELNQEACHGSVGSSQDIFKRHGSGRITLKQSSACSLPDEPYSFVI